VSKRFVHYHKVHANNTITRSKSGPLPTSSPIHVRIRTCCKMHGPPGPWPDRAYVTRGGRPSSHLPCLGAKHLVAVRAGQSTGRVPGDRESGGRVCG
jgi:hypothetical protein